MRPLLVLIVLLLTLFSMSSAFAQSDPGQQSSLFLQSASINGQSLTPSNRALTVSPGQALSGTATLSYNSAWPTNINVPLGVTRSWGNPENGFIGFGNAHGTGSKTVSFNYVAPTIPGRYYLIFAYRAEIDYADVFSMTNWAYSSGEKWRDGNDIASWSHPVVNTANTYGRALGQVLFNDGYRNTYVPATSIIIDVLDPKCQFEGPETSITVSSNQAWTDSGLTFAPGDIVSISSSGAVSWDSSRITTGPNGPGEPGGSCSALVTSSSAPSKSLVGNIASSSTLDGKGFFAGTTFCGTIPLNNTTSQSGKLLLGFNDNFVGCDRSGVDDYALGDNSGTFTAKVKIKKATQPDPSDPGQTSRLKLTGGALNGQTLSQNNKKIVVDPGQRITGPLDFFYNSTYGSNAVMVFAATPNWGNHQSSCIDYGSVATPAVATKTLNVDITAPLTPGTYYLLFQYRGEFTKDQVCSMTNWAAQGGNAVYNDGNDMADWSTSTTQTAQQTGNTLATILHADGYRPWYVPADAIAIKVEQPETTETLLYRETFDGTGSLPPNWAKIPGFANQESFSTQLSNGLLKVTGTEQGNIGLGYYGGLALPDTYTVTAKLRLAQRIAKPTSDQALVFSNLKNYASGADQQYLAAGWRQNQDNDFFLTGAGTTYNLGHIISALNFEEGQWHTIKIKKTGSNFKLYVDGQLGLDQTLPASVALGTIGLQLSQGIFEIDEIVVSGKPDQPPSQQCYSKVNDIPANCTGTITQDTKSGCRTIVCSQGSNSIKVQACNKPDSGPQYFEMYRQSVTGAPPKVCIGPTCIQNEGYKKSPNYPICVGSNTTQAPTNSTPQTQNTSISNAPIVEDEGKESTLFLDEGMINGRSVSYSNPYLVVQPGQKIFGSVRLFHQNAWPTTISSPLVSTPSWGNAQTSFRHHGNASGTNYKEVSIDVNAPTAPGTYYYLFAYRAEVDGGDVASMTNWVRTEVWGDGNDLAQWNSAMVSEANRNLRALAPILFGSDYERRYVPSTALVITVASSSSAAVTVRSELSKDHNVIVQCDAPFNATEFVWNFGDGQSYVKNNQSTFQYENQLREDFYLNGPMWKRYHHTYLNSGTYTISCTARNGVQQASGSTTVTINTPASAQEIAATLPSEDFVNYDPYIFRLVNERISGSKYRIGGYSLGLPHDDKGDGQWSAWVGSLPFSSHYTSTTESIMTFTFPEPGNYSFYLDPGINDDVLSPEENRWGGPPRGCSNPRTSCYNSDGGGTVVVPRINDRTEFGVLAQKISGRTYRISCQSYVTDQGGSGTLLINNDWESHKTYSGNQWFDYTFPADGSYEIRCSHYVEGNSIHKNYEKTLTVDSSQPTCTPTTETCNQKDDDCDGLIDENNVCAPSTCHTSVKTIPSTCTSTITSDTTSGNCRTILCGSGSNTIKVLACDKPDSGTKQYFEMYRQSASGSVPKVCLGGTCIQNEGYKKSPNFPLC